MNKTIVIKLLSKGYYDGKYTVKDFTDYLFILKDIIKSDELIKVRCNDNKFWSAENNTNRLALIHDLQRMRKRDLRDFAFFDILNRHANGDRYGIEKAEAV